MGAFDAILGRAGLCFGLNVFEGWPLEDPREEGAYKMALPRVPERAVRSVQYYLANVVR